VKVLVCAEDLTTARELLDSNAVVLDDAAPSETSDTEDGPEGR
jgi:hypothetical protein